MKTRPLLLLLMPFLYCSISIADIADLNIDKIDPDRIDPTMPSVVYHIKPKDFSIASYRQGTPSHFKLILCRRCKEKTYPLNPKAKLTFDQKKITQHELALIALKKEFNYITLAINRRTGLIDSFAFDTVNNTEI
ncbi:MAG: hypothetical protein ACI978_001483 [Oleispira sp.]|jgi:hypothetical protein